MTLSVKEQLNKYDVLGNRIPTALRELTGSDERSLRRLLGHLEANTRVTAELTELYCVRTEDYTGDDNLRLEIYADGEFEGTYKTDLNEGETWPLNKRFEFKSQLAVVLFDEDIDVDDELGHVVISALSHPSNAYTRDFDLDDALYNLRYTIENPRNGSVVSGRTGRGFDPSKHGFKFVNSFSTVDETIDLGILGLDPIRIDGSYGLCGGMSVAAKDFFLTGRQVPDDRAPPIPPSLLYWYLFQRQLDSFGEYFEYVAKFVDWHEESRGRLGAFTLGEWNDLRRRLDYGELVVLGLVYTNAEYLWRNHQVLAYGYRGQGRGEFELLYYDPNAPAQESRLKLKVSENEVQMNRHVGGFFVMNTPTVSPFAGL